MEEFKGMVDVTGGKMTLDEVQREIARILINRRPSRLLIDLVLVKDKGWITRFWISDKDFKKHSDDNWLLRDNLPYP